jgi:excisionase family DNA binding protein
MLFPANQMTTPLTLADRYMDLEGLAVYSSLSRSTLRRHIRDNQMPYFRVDGKLLVKQREFDSWLERYRGPDNLQAVADSVVLELNRTA